MTHLLKAKYILEINIDSPMSDSSTYYHRSDNSLLLVCMGSEGSQISIITRTGWKAMKPYWLVSEPWRLLPSRSSQSFFYSYFIQRTTASIQADVLPRDVFRYICCFVWLTYLDIMALVLLYTSVLFLSMISLGCQSDNEMNLYSGRAQPRWWSLVPYPPISDIQCKYYVFQDESEYSSSVSGLTPGQVFRQIDRRSWKAQSLCQRHPSKPCLITD